MPFNALLVDDDPVVLKTLKSVFQTRNFTVSTAPSAKDAIAAMSGVAFDLVVTDMRMETDTAGFDVVRSAKAKGNNPVIVILSAYPIPATEWRDAGADAMFLKGGGIFKILDDLDQLVRDRAGNPSPNVDRAHFGTS